MAVRKIFAILVAILMLCGMTTAMAAEPANLLVGNTDFEDGNSAKIQGWNADQLVGFALEQNVLHARKGAKSLLVTIPEEHAPKTVVTYLYKGAAPKLEMDTEYVFSAWVRTAEPLKLKGRPANDYGVQVYARVSGDAGNKYNLSPMVHDTKGDWMKIEKSFKLLTESDQVRFYIRFTENIYGSLYIDDVQLNLASDVPKDELKTEKDRGELISREPKPDASIVPVPEGSTNLFTNGSFEEVTASGAPAGGWAAFGSSWTDMVQVVDGGYDGNKCVRIMTETGANPWTYKEDLNVISGAEYQVTLWLKTNSVKGEGPRIKFEFYTDSGESVMSFQSEAFGQTYGAWHQKSARFKIPAGATKSKMYFRLYGAGEVYYDAVTCHKIGEASSITFDGDTFFYTEWETGTVGASVNNSVYTAKGDEVIDLKLMDGETVLKARENVKADPEAIIQFDVAHLSEIGKEYVIEATLYEKEGGKVLEKASWPVYRFDRPKMINENGEFVIDGEVITPVWGYHVYVADENMKLGKAAGVNIAQGGGGGALEHVIQYLDSAKANDMYASLVLYGGDAMVTAGHPTKIANTIEIVKAVKDHPALFGYIIMDEPYLHLSDPYPELMNAYKTIRSIDNVHPVIIQDTAATRSVKYTTALSDLLLMHEYACNVTTINRPDYGMKSMTGTIEKMRGLAENTHVRPKMMHCLGQTFGKDTKEEAGSYKYYLPTIDEARNMIYQACLEKVQGIGYYCFQSTGWHLKDTPLYAPLVTFGEKELPILTEAFIHDKEVFFNANKEGNVWWYTFALDGTLYAMAMNMVEETQNVEISLNSINDAVRIDGFTATLIGGTNLPETEKDSGSLKLELVSHGTALYKITPDEKVDFSAFEKSFDDMENHTWANEAVEYLYASEVVNATGIRTYSPAKNITRADFAMFLIRALNITGKATEVFADVDENAYYAKEIAIGRAAGILKGVGDNAYNPEAEITRQDMMVIVERGLAYVDKKYEKGNGTELDAFSDKAQVADYAVAALSSMVKSGIILGNADATVNPRGNATRAEAAMVMYRLMK